MGTIILIIVILVVLALVILRIDLYINKRYKAELRKSNDKKTLNLTASKPLENIKTNIRNNYALRNEVNNFRKKLQKARNQGKLEFFFHGEYYPTGLLVINGGK